MGSVAIGGKWGMGMIVVDNLEVAASDFRLLSLSYL